jgi:hypothetical protein
MRIFSHRINLGCITLVVFLVVGFFLIFIAPPVFRVYTKLNSDQTLPIEKVIGRWVQIGNNNSLLGDDGRSSGFNAYVILKNNGEYYLKYKCGNSVAFEESEGKWYYYSKRSYLLGFVPTGYQNWIKLNFDHKAEPQFYFKTDKNGNIRMYRGAYRACISEAEFKKVEHN